jgi:hypothetical protein
MIRAYLLILALAVAWTLAVLALAAWFCPCLAEAARTIDIQARGEAMKERAVLSHRLLRLPPPCADAGLRRPVCHNPAVMLLH